MADIDELKAELEKHRDEIKLKLHLASMDAKDEWAGLEQQWSDFKSRTQMAQSGEAIGGALGNLGEELKQAYVRFKQGL